jgi:parallel beta-helix repeat protein
MTSSKIRHLVSTHIASAILVAFYLPVWATDYFVSPYGSDSADGHAAASAHEHGNQGPFATFEPLARVILQNGDSILLACGQRYRGPLHLTLQSNAPGALTISRFGKCAPGDRPVIDGRAPLELAASSDLHTVASALQVVQVFAGAEPMVQARFPQRGYLIFPANTLSALDHVPEIATLGEQDFVGAVLHARTQEWYVEERNVIGSGNRFDSPLSYPLRPKAGAYLTGKAWMIGNADGWAYDSAVHSLYVRNKAAAPISIVYAGPLLSIEGHGSVSISGVAFDAAGGDAISVKTGGSVNIDDVQIRQAAGNGVAIAGMRDAQVTNSWIKDVGLDGIFFAEVARVVVRRNTVINAGIYLGPRPSLAAINAHRTNAATIEENKVLRSAYIGIRFSGDANIRRNYVKDSCLFLSDGAGLYTWRRNAADQRPPVDIAENIIVGVGGDASVKFGVNDYYAGIYLDEFTRNVTVRNNVVLGVRQGIYIHNAIGNRVEANLIGGAAKPMLIGISVERYPGEDTNTNVVTNNTVLSPTVRWSVTGSKGEIGDEVADRLIELHIIDDSASKDHAAVSPMTCEPVALGQSVDNSNGPRPLAVVNYCK